MIPPGTGEQVEPTEAQKKEDTLLGSYHSRASTFKVLMVSWKVFWPIYVMILMMWLVFSVIFLSQFFKGSYIYDIVPFFIIFAVVIVVPLIISLTLLQIKDDRIDVTYDSLRIFVHYMLNNSMVYNSIDISKIKRVRVAGKEYTRDLKKRTSLSNRFLTSPKPPPGGLYFFFNDPMSLIIIEMKAPVPVVNHSILTEKRIQWAPTLKRIYVKEVIVEVDRKYHNEFISLMKELIEEDKDMETKKEKFLEASRKFRTRIEKKGLKLSDLS